MATVTVPNRPGLTKYRAMELFKRRFVGVYDVYMTNLHFIDFIVKESRWVGVGVTLKHADKGVRFVISGLVPSYTLSVFLNLLGGGLVTFPLARLNRKNLEEEIKMFIESEAEFH